jgi:uncharacterized protein (TIGR03546 family)
MLIRKFGSILRGRATPLQIFLGGLLGGLLAFQPGWYEAPGLLAALVALLLVTNATLGLALLVAGLGHLLALALMPITFEVGRVLIDGPTSSLFQSLINAPVLAWFGFECYVASGGLLVGGVFGIAVGALFALSVSALRRRLAGLEEGSERYQKAIAKPWVKVLLFLFVGGSRGKKSWSELAGKRVGNPIRIWGVLLVVALLVVGWLAQDLLGGPLVAEHLRSSLQDMNGATVDLGGAEVSLAKGRMRVNDLAMADPDELERDLFRSAVMDADAGVEDLLRKRLVVDRLLLRDARSGIQREVPGERITPPEPTPEVPPHEDGAKTIDDYLADARKWRDRLRTAREWLEKLSPEEEEGTAEEREESLGERLEREAREKGWAAVRATHLIEETPAFLVREIKVEGLVLQSFVDETFDVEGNSFSTAPALVAEQPRFSMKSRSGKMDLKMDLATGLGSEAFAFDWRALPAETINAQLRQEGEPLLRGGTVDLSLHGGWSAGRVGWIDAPLAVVLRDTTLSISGLGSAPIQELSLPIHLEGPLDALSIRIDPDQLASALKAAGAAELERRLREELGSLESKAREEFDEKKAELEDKARKEAGEKLEEEVGDKAKGVLDGLLGGQKKKADGGR